MRRARSEATSEGNKRSELPYVALYMTSQPTLLVASLIAASEDAIDLMNRCLQFNPENRCTAKEALAHPFIAEFHNPDDEPDYPNGPITISLDDNQKLTASDYRDKLYREINERRKAARRREQERAAAAKGGKKK